MGIGVQALFLTSLMKQEGLFRDKTSVMELGSQQFAPDLNAAKSAIAEFFPEIDREKIHVPRDLYAEIGIPHYSCIDLDGANDAYVFDLNRPLKDGYNFTETFDIVTNHGTTEHAFNQFECFRNVHAMTKPDGLMIHALPSQGYQNHSFFNYHPSFFLDLASSNRYDVIGLYYNVDERLLPYTDDFLQVNDIKATQNLAVFAVLRRTDDQEFVTPFDGRYYFEQRGSEFVPRSDVGSHSRVADNQFPLSKLYYSPDPGDRNCATKIVLPVWGRSFTESFIQFSLRSQVHNKSLEFDDRNNIEYLIVTDFPSGELIMRSDEYAELVKAARVKVVHYDRGPAESSYSRLTNSYNAALDRAQPDDLYIFITSDCFFSNEVFRSVKRKAESSRLVMCPALRVIEESFVADVNVRGSWNVDGREALELAMRNEHPITEAFCLNNTRRAIHPLPAQTIERVAGGYVGRWNVMHPLGIKIANTVQRISQTIDHSYPISQIRGWQDVSVLDSIDDGLTVSLTPFDYDQGERIRGGASRGQYLSNLKNWVNIPWALDFHMAQISHPVRLLTSPEPPGQAVLRAEQEVGKVVSDFIRYVNRRKLVPRKSFTELSAADMLRPALDLRQSIRLMPRTARKTATRLKARLKSRLFR